LHDEYAVGAHWTMDPKVVDSNIIGDENLMTSKKTATPCATFGVRMLGP